MRRSAMFVIALVTAALLGLPGVAASAPAPTIRYIVTVDAGGHVGALATSLLDRVGGGELVSVYEHALDGFVVDLPVDLVPVLAALGPVSSIEPDGVVTLSDTQDEPPYGLDRIDQRDLPLSGDYTYDFDGTGVDAYIIDTGIRGTHTQFGGRVRAGVNTVDSSAPTDDCNGHGTHVAGTVGGADFGVAKNVSLVAVRVFGCGNSTTTSAIIDGVEWVVADHDAGAPAVANMSLGGGASAALDSAVEGMVADGVAVAVASGNSSADGCSGSPAGVEPALTVGATDGDDERASFSNFGTCVDVHAPGVSIQSAAPASDTATATLSGTSMAAPHVAGAVALYLDEVPGATPAQAHAAVVDSATRGAVGGIATSCSFLENLLGTCTAGTPNRLLYTGFGEVPPEPEPQPAPAPCSGLSAILGLC